MSVSEGQVLNDPGRDEEYRKAVKELEDAQLACARLLVELVDAIAGTQGTRERVALILAEHYGLGTVGEGDELIEDALVALLRWKNAGEDLLLKVAVASNA